MLSNKDKKRLLDSIEWEDNRWGQTVMTIKVPIDIEYGGAGNSLQNDPYKEVHFTFKKKTKEDIESDRLHNQFLKRLKRRK